MKFGRKKDGTVDKKNMRKFVIRQVNWFYEWDKLTYWLAIFLTFYHQVIDAAILPDSKDDIIKFRDNVRMAISKGSILAPKNRSEAFKALCEICKFANKDVKWMKKNFTIDDWVEVFLYMYLYNVLGKKKGLITVYETIGLAQSNLNTPKPKSIFGLKKDSQ